MLEIAKNILLIENFLTSEECNNYLNYSEYLGFQFADVDVHGVRKQIKQIRTNAQILNHRILQTICGKN